MFAIYFYQTNAALVSMIYFFPKPFRIAGKKNYPCFKMNHDDAPPKIT